MPNDNKLVPNKYEIGYEMSKIIIGRQPFHTTITAFFNILSLGMSFQIEEIYLGKKHLREETTIRVTKPLSWMLRADNLTTQLGK